MSKINAKILILDDDQSVLYTAKMILGQEFEHVITENNPEMLEFLLSTETFDVIVLDMNFSYGLTGGKEGIKLLKKALEYDPEAHVLMNTSHGDIEIAVEAMKAGAVDFLVKPWPKEKLLATVKALYQLTQSKRRIKEIKTGQRILSNDFYKHYAEIICESPAMEKVLGLIDEAANTNDHVLIQGEKGVGKDMVAHAIHNKSKRKGENIVKVDLNEISENLFESELFGYLKGSFKGARLDTPGRIELADKGTLLLNGVENLKISSQKKLLTALQSLQISRVGSNDVLSLSARIISMSDGNLKEIIEKQQLKKELYDRMSKVEIHIPPLRDRLEDIEPLALYFMKRYSKKYKKGRMRLNDSTIERLRSYHWPGNVRELENAIERAIIMSSGRLLAPEDFILIEKPQQNVITTAGFNIDEMEKQAIQNAIRNAEGNLTKAAQALGMGRSTLYRKMTKYKL